MYSIHCVASKADQELLGPTLQSRLWFPHVEVYSGQLVSNYSEHTAGHQIRPCTSPSSKACIAYTQAQATAASVFLQCQSAKLRRTLGVSISTAFTTLIANTDSTSPSGLCFFLQGKKKVDQQHEVCSTCPWGVCSTAACWAAGSRVESSFSPNPNNCSPRRSWKPVISLQELLLQYEYREVTHTELKETAEDGQD